MISKKRTLYSIEVFGIDKEETIHQLNFDIVCAISSNVIHLFEKNVAVIHQFFHLRYFLHLVCVLCERTRERVALLLSWHHTRGLKGEKFNF